MVRLWWMRWLQSPRTNWTHFCRSAMACRAMGSSCGPWVNEGTWITWDYLRPVDHCCGWSSYIHSLNEFVRVGFVGVSIGNAPGWKCSPDVLCLMQDLMQWLFSSSTRGMSLRLIVTWFLSKAMQNRHEAAAPVEFVPIRSIFMWIRVNPSFSGWLLQPGFYRIQGISQNGGFPARFWKERYQCAAQVLQETADQDRHWIQDQCPGENFANL